MRRPLCLYAVSFAAGIFLGFNLGPVRFFAAFFIFAAMLITAIRARVSVSAEKIICVALIFFLFGGAGLFAQKNKTESELFSLERRAAVEGTVVSIQKKDIDKFQLIVKTDEEKSKILVNVYGDLAAAGIAEKYGDIAGRNVRVDGKPEAPPERRNPNTFDYGLYLRAKGVSAVMNIKTYDLELPGDNKNIFINRASNIRCDFSEKIMKVMSPENAGILLGMLLGDKNFIDGDVYEMFQKNGTAHILAVSGIHVGMVYLMFGKILYARRNILLNIVLLMLLIAYAALASFSPSVLRAGGMIALHILSKLFCLRYDMLCAGSGIALAMMIHNPMVIFDTGFELSFLAVFILAIIVPAALRVYDSGITAALTLQAGLAPATSYLFNYFSFSAFLINVPVIIIAGVIVPLGIIMIPLSYMPVPAFPICARVLDSLCGLMYGLNEFTYSGGMFCDVVSPPVWAVFIFYGTLFFWCAEASWVMRKRGEWKKLLTATAIIAALSVVSTVPFQNDFHKAQMIFVDVGQGDCLHIKTPGGKNILIDGGGSQTYDVGKGILKPYLLKNGVKKIDIAFVSHRHMDHYGGIVSLARNFSVGKLCFYEANRMIESDILSETGLGADQLIYLVKGMRIIIDEDVWLETLYPEQKSGDEYRLLTSDSADENEMSLILKVHYRGLTVLMTGDINESGESDLIRACENGDRSLKSDILKVPHHGSKYSSGAGFIAEVGPSYAIFQVGKNNFGHPTAEALERYADAGAAIYRNDKQGAIAVFIKKEGGPPVIKTIILEK